MSSVWSAHAAWCPGSATGLPLHLMCWQLGRENTKALLQRDPFAAKLVIGREARWVSRLCGVALGVDLLLDTSITSIRI